ncbi:MAG: AAA family ATPase [Bdellovibrionota bacterium]
MRYLDKFLCKDMEKMMILLSGARQCGKTTYSKWLINHHDTGVYLNWDQIKDRKKIIQQDWDEDAAIVVLDEIHKKKLWKTFLKGIFDTKKPNMRLLVTGSARMEYFQKSGDSMFGRYRSWRLHPFCMSEDPLHLSLKDRFNRLLERGGFPYPYLAKKPEEAGKALVLPIFVEIYAILGLAAAFLLLLGVKI